MQKVFQLFALATMGLAQVQPVANDSPQDVYAAHFDKKIDGDVKFKGLPNGSIEISVDLSGFPQAGGPFLYHVHEHPVPTDGNCTGTLGHLNPYHGNPEAKNPDELEIGDLSGRYGKIHQDHFETQYVDQYLSLNPDSKAFIGGLSVTIHLNNTTRIACANITKVDTNNTQPVVISSAGGAATQGFSTVLMSGLVAGMALLI